MAESDRLEHGVYVDPRQRTGFAWYCPKQDWRFAISRAEVPNPFWFCPGCSVDVTDEAYGEICGVRP